MNQPKTIRFEGVTYTLLSRCKTVSKDPPITEGPFYSCPGVNPKDWAYTPNTEFLHLNAREARDAVPDQMHCIQQCVAPSTPHPA